MNTARLPPQNPSILQQAPNYVTKRQVLRYVVPFLQCEKEDFQVMLSAVCLQSEQQRVYYAMKSVIHRGKTRLQNSNMVFSPLVKQHTACRGVTGWACCLLFVERLQLFIYLQAYDNSEGVINSDVLSLRPVLCFDAVSADLTNDGEHGNKWTDQNPFEYLVTIIGNKQLDAQFFLLYLFIPILYMFRATKCSSSGESIVSIRPLVYVTLCR